MVGVKTGEVAVSECFGQFRRNIFERRTIRYVCVIDTVDGGSFCGDMNSGIKAKRFDRFRPVRESFDITKFDNAVGSDV